MDFKTVIKTTMATAIFSNSAFADPSAKFAADWATTPVTLAEIIKGSGSSSDSSTDAEVRAAELMATIKVPQKKELLIGVSGEARLITLTSAKGKNNDGVQSSSSDTTLSLEVRYAPAGAPDACVSEAGKVAAPGPITFASRKQTLSVDVTGFDSLEGAVEVGLELDTVAAHHFNFIAPNLDSGQYDVWACFSGEAITTVSDADGDASAFVAIQKRIITVQEVRAVNSDFTL